MNRWGIIAVSIRRTNGAEDLQGHAVFAQRFDPLDAGRLEEAMGPVRVAGQLPTNVVDDAGRLVEVGAVGDGDVLVDAGPDAGHVRGHRDRAIRDAVDGAGPDAVSCKRRS